MHNHIPIGSHITGLNGGACPVRRAEDFYACIGSECRPTPEKSLHQWVGYCTTLGAVALENTWTGQGVLCIHVALGCAVSCCIFCHDREVRAPKNVRAESAGEVASTFAPTPASFLPSLAEEPPDGDCCSGVQQSGPARFCFLYDPLSEVWPRLSACIAEART